MQVVQAVLRNAADIPNELASLAAVQPNLVLAFGSVDLLQSTAPFLAVAFPAARRIGCSTAGEISSDGVADGTCVVTAVRFDKTSLAEVSTQLSSMDDSRDAGQRELAPPSNPSNEGGFKNKVLIGNLYCNLENLSITRDCRSNAQKP